MRYTAVIYVGKMLNEVPVIPVDVVLKAVTPPVTLAVVVVALGVADVPFTPAPTVSEAVPPPDPAPVIE
jgi:hypothetical protein